MAPVHYSRATIAALAPALLALPSPVTAGKWEGYPVCVRSILDKYAPPACWYGSSNVTQVYESNKCLCADKTFLRHSAIGEYKACGCDDFVEATANLTYNCEQTGTPAAYNYTTIIAIGTNQTDGCVDSPSPTSGGSSSTSTSTSTSTNVPDHHGGGLDTGSIIAIAVGVPAAIAGIIVAILACCK